MTVDGERDHGFAPGRLAAAWPRELLDVALLVVDRTDSTQRLARAVIDRYLGEEEEPPACLVVALAQTAGRGRRGRRWISEAGRGLWASLVHAAPSGQIASLPMRATLALAEALDDLGTSGLGIKWPNDLVARGRKLAGVLVDVVDRGESGCWAIVGFGLNLNVPREPVAGAEPAALEELLGDGAEVPELGTLAGHTATALRNALAETSGEWLERYRGRIVHRPGDSLRCRLDEGEVSGRFSGFDERGFLRLAVEGGERILSSGEVFAW